MSLHRRDAAHWAAWAFIGLAALVSRLWGLGLRAMSHDESLHAYFSLQLANHGSHIHDPMMHGPLLFQLSAPLLWLFGPSDFWARLPMALAGAGLVLSPLLLVRRLGRAGALAAGALLLISPVALYYGRYMRNDALFGILCVAWLWAMWRYLEAPSTKRLWPLSGVMALAFACKETVFIFGGFAGLYMLIRGLAQWRAAGGDPRRVPALQLAVIMLAASLPFASPLAHLALGWSPVDFTSPEALWHGKLVIGLAGAAGVGLCWLWFRGGPAEGGMGPWDAIGPVCLVWLVDLLLFGNWGRNLTSGMISGFVGSVGYWLAQQGVARGGQPWFYYLMLLVVYEFLPLAAALGGAMRLARRQGRAGGFGSMGLLLAAWAAYSLAAYSLAGEKMPWLLLHISLPLCLLGGWWLGGLWGRVRRAEIAAGRLAAVALALVPMALAGTGVAWRAAYVLDESPRELLVYAHGTPYTKPVLRRALAVARVNPGRGTLIYDQESAWPMAWYAAMFPRWLMSSAAKPEDYAEAAAVILAQPDREQSRALAPGHTPEMVTVIWWPVQDYLGMNAAGLASRMADTSFWRGLWRYWLWREVPGADEEHWPLRKDLWVFIRQGAAGEPTPAPPAGKGPAADGR